VVPRGTPGHPGGYHGDRGVPRGSLVHPELGIPRGTPVYSGVPRCIPGYPVVPQCAPGHSGASRGTYGVPRGPPGYPGGPHPGVSRCTLGYPGIPLSTPGNPEVSRNTSGYPGVRRSTLVSDKLPAAGSSGSTTSHYLVYTSCSRWGSEPALHRTHSLALGGKTTTIAMSMPPASSVLGCWRSIPRDCNHRPLPPPTTIRDSPQKPDIASTSPETVHTNPETVRTRCNSPRQSSNRCRGCGCGWPLM
jgi:hypothetical protein